MTASASDTPAGTAYPNGKMPLSIYFGWGLGTLGIATFAIGSFLLLRFMTDYMGVPPALAGLIFAAAKIYDAVADPIAGSLSDRTRSRWGRRRPYLLAGAFACGIVFLLIFNAPVMESSTSAAIMLAVLLILHATAYAIFAVPYMAMPAEMTDNPHERSKLMSFRVVNASLGNFMGGFATASLIAWLGGGLAGHRVMGVVMGLFIFAVLMGCFFLTAKAKTKEVERGHDTRFLSLLRQSIRNRPFRVLLIVKLILLSGLGFHIASTAFFVQRSLGMSDMWMGVIFATGTAGTIASQPFWLWAAKTYSKRITFCWAATFTAIGWFAWFPLGHGTPGWMIVSLGLLNGLGAGGMAMVSQSMLPDAIEYEFRTTGARIAGGFAGLYVMVEKLGLAVGTSVVGITLGLFGYIEARGGVVVEQPASAILGVSLAFAVFSAAFLIVSVTIMLFYPLDERTMTLRQAKAAPETAEMPSTT